MRGGTGTVKTAHAVGGISTALLAFAVVTSASAQPAQKIPNFMEDETVGWLAAGNEFLPPLSGPHPVTPDPEHPYIQNPRGGRQPTLRVADLDNPILQPWVKDALKKVNDRVLAGKPAFPPQVRCWPLGVPGFVLYTAQPTYIIQKPNEVLMIWQSDQMVRHIYLTGKHSEHVTPSWFGESIGHYEGGDTLVVDTIGLNTKSFVDNTYRTPHTDQLHVVERFKLTNVSSRIEVTVTVEDPGAFTTPGPRGKSISASRSVPWPNPTCAEGNINYFNFDFDPPARGRQTRLLKGTAKRKPCSVPRSYLVAQPCLRFCPSPSPRRRRAPISST